MYLSVENSVPEEMTSLFSAEIANPLTFAATISLLSHFTTEAEIVFTGHDGVIIHALDPGQTTYLLARLPNPGAFSRYVYSGNTESHRVFVSLKSLHASMDHLKETDGLILSVDSVEDDEVKVDILAQNMTVHRRVAQLYISNGGSFGLDVDDLDGRYQISLLLDVALFSRLLGESTRFGDVVTLKVNRETQVFSVHSRSESIKSHAKIRLTDLEDVSFNGCMENEMVVTVKSAFLSSVARATKVATQVLLELGHECPVAISLYVIPAQSSYFSILRHSADKTFSVDDSFVNDNMGVLRFWIAPFVLEEDSID
jgi:hypothetical protein